METYIEAFSIDKEKKSYADFEIHEDVQQKIMEMRDTMNEDQIYEALARSIAPEIFGMEDIKKALLLLMGIRNSSRILVLKSLWKKLEDQP